MGQPPSPRLHPVTRTFRCSSYCIRVEVKDKKSLSACRVMYTTVDQIADQTSVG